MYQLPRAPTPLPPNLLTPCAWLRRSWVLCKNNIPTLIHTASTSQDSPWVAMAPGTQLSAGLAILLLLPLLLGPAILQRPPASLNCPSGLFMVLVMAVFLYLVRVT